MTGELETVRDAIDRIDSELLRLLNERMKMARRIARIKAEGNLPLFDAGREEAILSRLITENRGPLPEESLRSIYREIFAASRQLQHPLRVAFLGPEWSYSHLAALSLFGHTAYYVPLPTLVSVFDALCKGQVHVAIAPIENSLEGGIGWTMDLLYERQVVVIRECYLEISHCLASRQESLDGIENLYGQPQAMGQCRGWLLENLQQAIWHECPSTAEAARLAHQDPKGGAICNLYAASHYGLNILKEGIEDRPGNTTRFFALAKHSSSPTGNDKTSILFAVRDKPGALHAALGPLTLWGLNMSRIESRPNRLIPWQYLFYADIEGHQDEPRVRAALQELEKQVAFFKILGSYPKSDPMKPIRFNRERLRNSDFESQQAWLRPSANDEVGI